MAAEQYLGVILAAGHGSRMGPFGEEVPKPVAPICNKPLLVYQLEHLRGLGITDIIIVIGHLGHVITQILGNGAAYGVRIRYVEQEKRLGLAHAVGQLEKLIDRPFFLMLGDIYFEVDDLAQMIRTLEQQKAAAVLAVKDENDANAIRKNFSVHLHADGTVKRVIEKPRHIENRLKGCGLYLFDLHIFDAIRRTPRTALRDEYELTDSIQILVELDYRVCIAPVVTWDMNLTFIHDLIACCQRQLRHLGQHACIGTGCTIPEGCTLIDTVLGDGVHIEHPITLERCVVLPGSRVRSRADLRDCVITPSALLPAADAPPA
ncbi:MAG: NTP transferase domain-containing protein [Candidatus Hydrogenedentes bacterium]|nr:NTP transferase domain-containing protein [Candidatus Hydrogenedentota bacterium]